MNLSPREAVVTSTCKSGKPSRDLDVYPFATDYDWSFSLSFEKTSGGYALTKVSTSWDYDSRFVDSSLFGRPYLKKFLDTLKPLDTFGKQWLRSFSFPRSTPVCGIVFPQDVCI